MSGFYLHTSNNLEKLLDDLSVKISQNPLPPLMPETIIIQSRGMEKWLSLKLSLKSGIWANSLYPFPNKAVEKILKSVIPEMPDERLFNTERILFEIMKYLPSLFSEDEFAEIRNYVSSGNNLLKTYQISGIIADLFDQYLTFRPDMLLNWDQGKGNSWQAKLWRKLRSESRQKMPHEYRKLFFENLSRINISKLPPRIFIFGVSYMPNFHLDIIRAASEFIDIHLYMLNPSLKYWFDIKPEKVIQRIKIKTGKTEEDLHLETGNRLLASWGKSGKEFLEYIYGNDPIETGETLFEQPDSSSMLGAIKYAILNLEDPEPIIVESEKIKTDKSIRIHCCHSSMREIEVLYDNILDMFSRHKNLKPEEILVMAPDIEKYSRFINAVFIDGEIPYAISDRSYFRQNRVVDVFFKIIDFSGSRFESDRVLEIIEYEEIRKKISLSSDDIEKIKIWISETNTAWGLNAEHKNELGLPDYIENTWEMFVKRLLLGYAMPGDNGNFFNDILPYDNTLGKDSFVIGNFLDFLDSLKKYYKALSSKNSLAGWAEIFENIFTDFINEDELSDFKDHLFEQLNLLREIQDKSCFDDPVDLAIIRDFLTEKLKKQKISANYLNGSVTFCEMLPMRSIPFKIICMIGMNDDSFPRNRKPVSFDLLNEKPLPGDRNIRDEDRYLFLETLISAEKELYISYIGQNINDNSIMPPSVLVSELLDYIDTFAVDKNGIGLSVQIQIKHRLQGFSRVYFTGNKEIFSFSKENFSVSENLKRKKEKKLPFYTKTSAPKTFSSSITNQTLFRFFKDPSKFFVNRILGINLDLEKNGIGTEEKFILDNLDNYIIGSRAYTALIEKKEDSLFSELKAEGVIPHGNMGKYLVNNAVNNFIDAVNEIGIVSKPESIKSSIVINDFEIFFQVENVFHEGILNIKNSNINAHFLIRAWINHLLINTTKRKKSLIAAREDKKLTLWSFNEINPDQALSHLIKLIDIFKNGVNSPLMFMPEISFKSVMENSSKKFLLNDDSDLKYFNLIFGDTGSPEINIKESIEFRNNSISVCLPIVQIIKDEKILS